MPFFQIMWPNLRNCKNRFLMMSHFGTLTKACCVVLLCRVLLNELIADLFTSFLMHSKVKKRHYFLNQDF